ncbi:uncharacterized protein BT62DRAFT_474553 [Guyanagaster necrorhizus]|uniref:Uncharacterized protein n=1 Tax=Guyanagaster necrorhizus TaxID=856835 RepID=A0A9P7VJ73_9AGAR|nr:uncharacterized protein BT62DRAFT_474553 [Guyanagaster necrorhizus MCA 3950]KAG7441587.1 hypothetical protein BT62DRAFT_474553 [Guyanagaster necrorhizus MCA 3950]
MPSFVDVCTFPEFQHILELPIEHVVTEASFADALNELPTLIEDWQQRRESRLRAMVPPQESRHIDPLKLATTVFSCKRCCGAIITNADIWWHRRVNSCRPGRIYYQDWATNVDDLYGKLGNKELFFDTKRSAVTASLLRLASCNPTMTSAEEMDNLDL